MAQDFILEVIRMRRPQEEKIQIDETAARTAPGRRLRGRAQASGTQRQTGKEGVHVI